MLKGSQKRWTSFGKLANGVRTRIFKFSMNILRLHTEIARRRTVLETAIILIIAHFIVTKEKHFYVLGVKENFLHKTSALCIDAFLQNQEGST